MQHIREKIAETSSAFLEDVALGKWHSTCSSLSKHNNQTIICKMRGHLSHHSPVLPFARASSGQGCRSDRTRSPRMAPGTICISISCTVAASTRIAAAACTSRQSLRNNPLYNQGKNEWETTACTTCSTPLLNSPHLLPLLLHSHD